MAKVPMNNVLYLNRRFLSVAATATAAAAAAAAAAPTAKVMTKVPDPGIVKSESPEERKQNFWMKDPNTGYWIPENHFGGTDVADLRDKLLSKK